MSKSINDKNLSDLEIGNIEYYLNAGDTPAEIGRKLGRDSSGIRKDRLPNTIKRIFPKKKDQLE